MRCVLLAAMSIALAACSANSSNTSPAAAPGETTLAGIYEFQANMEGQPPLPGQIKVEEKNGQYGGYVLTDVFPPIPVTSVAEENGVVTIVGSPSGGELRFRITIAGDRFAGEWSASDGTGGTVTGTRRPLS